MRNNVIVHLLKLEFLTRSAATSSESATFKAFHLCFVVKNYALCSGRYLLSSLDSADPSTGTVVQRATS